MKWIKAANQLPPFEMIVLVPTDLFDSAQGYAWAALIQPEGTSLDVPYWQIYMGRFIEIPLSKIAYWMEIIPPDEQKKEREKSQDG